MSSLTVGDEAPDFELSDDAGNTVRLRDLRGRPVVVYFYPKDDTPGCTKEACGFRDGFGSFEAKNAVVLGVSPDSVDSHAKFKAKYGLPFPLLADEGAEVAKSYGAWGKKKLYGREYEGLLRKTFVVDADGRLVKVFNTVRPADHWEQVLKALS